MVTFDMAGCDLTSKDSNREVANNDPALMPNSVSYSMENDDDMTGGDMAGGDLTSKDPADSSVKKLGFCMIGGVHTVDLLNKNNQQLKDNTAANATTSLQAASLNKSVTSVWKLSQHQPRSSSSAAISRTIWRKIKPYKVVGDIKSTSTKFQELRANFVTNK